MVACIRCVCVTFVGYYVSTGVIFEVLTVTFLRSRCHIREHSVASVVSFVSDVFEVGWLKVLEMVYFPQRACWINGVSSRD